MPRDQQQVQRRLDRARVLQHVGEQLAEHLRLQRIQVVVAVEDVLRQLRVALDEGVERVAQRPGSIRLTLYQNR
jgi:hypothetical protein